ncbi:MAG: OmpA family protein [Bacteroidales bacterium]|jgi:outer membrane protein OmpA-like peptidoglycan-associated protein|nr:OmpA family protein [Bacteroidales bacterium]
MKKTLFLLSLIAIAFTATAQEEVQEKGQNDLKWRWFKTNGFWDNWEISVGIGPTWFVKYAEYLNESGDYSANPEFKNLTNLSLDVSVGKWVNPIVGARLVFQYARGTSYVGPYPDPVVGITAGQKVSFNYTFLHYDQMWNLTNWICGYKFDRTYNAVFTTGFGWAHNLSYHNNNEFAFFLGLQNRFRMSDRWNFNAELNMMLTKADFDVISTFTPAFGSDRFSTAFSLSVGLTYKFPISTWEGSPICPDLDPYNDRIASLENDLDNAMKALDEANKQIAKDQDAKDKCAKDLEDALAKLKECESRPAQVISSAINNTDVSFTIFFDKGDILTTDAQNTIDQVANIIKNNNPNTSYLIVGYADKSTGTYQGNMNISKKRAERVQAALVKKGIKKTQLKIDWKGDTEQPYSTESGILNRVVVITMIK